MGQIRLDMRGEKPVLTFYVGNGVKVVPRKTIVVDAVTPELISAAVDEGLAAFRVRPA